MLYAGFFRRLVAYIIDYSIVAAIQVGLYLIISIGYPSAALPISTTDPTATPTDLAPEAWIGSLVVGLGVPFLYFTLMESSHTMATFGKLILGIYVSDTRGEQISYGAAVVRFLGKILSALFCYIGFLMILFTGRNQGLHDMLAGTLVLRTGRAAATHAARGYSAQTDLDQLTDYWDGTRWIKPGQPGRP
jgi:uncharacterized RDD family membrane protein YckC